jgi:transposase-like protein
MEALQQQRFMMSQSDLSGMQYEGLVETIATRQLPRSGFVQWILCRRRHKIHKARNIMERLSPALHASVRRALRQAWELDDAAKAEKLIRNLAQRLERDAPGVSKSILEGLDEILTVSRLGLPAELRRSLACTNIIENMMGTVRRVTRNVKRWSSSLMALRWTAAAMQEAKKGFRRLKAFKQLPALKAALAAHYERETNNGAVAQRAKAA